MKQMKKQADKKRKRKETARQPKSAAPRLVALRCFLFTLLIGAVGILAVSLGLSFMPDPGPMIRPFALLIAGLTALSGGFNAGRKSPLAPILSGAVNGLLLAALMLTGSLLLRHWGTGYPPYLAALLHTGVILLSILGAGLSGMRRKNRHSGSRR